MHPSIRRYTAILIFEHYIRYAPLAVGLKPSAIQGEARLRGLEQNNYSKTISPPACRQAGGYTQAKPACAGSCRPRRRP